MSEFRLIAIKRTIERVKLGGLQIVQGDFKVNPYNPRLPSFETSSKKPRSNKNSPENFPKRSRTYAEVISDDLVMFISERGREIDVTKAGLLEKALMKELLCFIEANPTLAPTYYPSSTRFGSLCMVCADRISALWFTRTVSEIQTPVERR